MLWTTKLTTAGLSQEKFGLTFNGKAKKYNKYAETLAILKKQLKDHPGDAKTAEQIEVVQQELGDLNTQLCRNIDRYIKNPEKIERDKERMRSLSKKAKTPASSNGTEKPTSATASAAPTVTEEPPEAVTTPAATAPPVASPTKTEPTKPNATAAATATPPAPKKKSGVGAALGWGCLSFAAGIALGFSLRK